jgi:hypothetical protein
MADAVVAGKEDPDSDPNASRYVLEYSCCVCVCLFVCFDGCIFFETYSSAFFVLLFQNIIVGSHVECMYHLMTFGIPIRNFPVSNDVEIKTEKYLQWVESMKRLEDSEKSKTKSTTQPADGGDDSICLDGEGADTSTNNSGVASSSHVTVPSRKDILFGRGKPIQEHPGNLRLGLILESFFDRYEALKRSEKTNLAQEVVLKVKSQGGRFLRQADGMWEAVDDDTAREKVSHTFRSLRSAASKPEKKGSKNKKVSDDENSEEGDYKKRPKVE